MLLPLHHWHVTLILIGGRSVNYFQVKDSYSPGMEETAQALTRKSGRCSI